MKTKEKIKKKNEKSKKSLLLTFFFFTFSLLICSCFNPFAPDIDRFPAVTPPAGMGSFLLSLSGASRTILPSTPALTHFNKLVLVFTAESVGAVTKTETVDPYISSSPLPAIFLQPGTYSLTVTAYKDTAVAARGTLDSITISLGGNTPGTVTLKALLSEAGTSGTFSWDITLDSSINTSTAAMTITMPTGVEVINLGLLMSGNRTLPSGIYNVIFNLEQTVGGKQLVWKEVVHIYSTLESNFTKNFELKYFNSDVYTVTFNVNGGSAVGGQSVLHGDTIPNDITTTRTAAAYLHLGTPAAPGFVFDGWYADSALANAWNYGTKVIRDVTLYAKWTGAVDLAARTETTEVEKAVAYVNANPAAYTLYVGADFNVPTQTINTNNVNLTILGLDTERKIKLSATGNLFVVGGTANNVELTIGENITLAGHDSNPNVMVKVQNGAKFTMLNGSKIVENHYGSGSNDNSAIAVLVTGNNTVFTMEGGEITGNATMAVAYNVYVGSGGTFNMSGGSISNVNGKYDVSVNYDASSFSLSGDAYVGKLVLITDTASSSAPPVITIRSGWSGSVGNLNLRGNSSQISDVISFWEGRQVLQAASGYTLTANDAAKFTLGYFSSSNTSSSFDTLIANAHSLKGSAPNIGYLVPWDLQTEVNKYAAATSDMTISVPLSLTLPANINVPANSGGYTLTITSASGGPYTITRGQQDTTVANGLFIVQNGAKLILQNIVIDGDQTNHTGNNASLVNVNGGELTLGNGAKLINNRAANGGGVFTSGTFTMSGGEISGNEASGGGGGVFVTTGTFTMSGSAVISGNEASGNNESRGGGVYNRGTFTMSGSAVIRGNTASSTSPTGSNGGGNGGGVYNDGGTFTMSESAAISGNTANGNTATKGGGGVFSFGIFNMSGGTIERNEAVNGGGVGVNGGNFTMSGTSVVSENEAGNYGGGVYVTGGTFSMTGGTIGGATGAGNTAANSGGGVFVTGGSSTFTMSGGTVSDNKANGPTGNGGGGVYVSSSGTFNMSGNAAISANTALNGGGVFVTSTGSAFTMNGGEVSNNTATNGYGGGGGVYVISSGTFTMNGGIVSGNKNTGATGNGGGVYVSGTFRIVTGTVYGTNESDASLHNTAAVGGASLYNSGTAEYGTLSGTTWTSKGTLATTNDTIRVANGELGAFASTADLSSWLSGQSGSGPFTVKMNVNSLGGSKSDLGSVGNALSNSVGKYVTLDLSGSTLTSIDAQAFTECKLIDITFPAGLTSIGMSAFYNCTSLTSITISAGLTSIDDRAFYLCDNLTTVTFEGNTINSFGADAFPGGNNLRAAYQAAGDGAGTYTRSGSGNAGDPYVWTKQP